MVGLRLRNAFFRVARFVSEARPQLAGVGLRGESAEVKEARKTSPRVFMCASIEAKIICTWAPAVDKLPESHLIGLLLHEYGHLAGNASEEGADAWVWKTFGIPIEYRDHGPAKDLEWVDPRIIKSSGI
jgi:hypothetical protein